MIIYLFFKGTKCLKKKCWLGSCRGPSRQYVNDWINSWGVLVEPSVAKEL